MTTCHYRPKPGQVVVGDPIDVVTGASLDTQTDFVLAGPLPLRWYRNYDSGKHDMPGSLGWGQFHEYDRKLVFDLDGMRYVGPDGESFGLPHLEHDGQAAVAGGVTVRRVSKRQYTVQTTGQPLATFDLPAGRTVAPLSALSAGTARVAFRYDQDGLLHTVVDSKSRPIRVEHDRSGRLARLTLADGPRARRLAEYQYDTAGNLVRVTDPYNHVFQSKFDRDNRQVARIDRRGYGFVFEYDAAGRCVRGGGQDGTDEVRLRYDPDLRLTVVTKRGGGDWTYFYDEGGSVTRVLAPDGGLVQFNRDETGRVAEEVDPLGNVTRKVFNAAGVPVGKIDPLGIYRTADDTATGRPPHRVPANPAEWDYGDRLGWRQVVLPTPGEAAAVDPAAGPFLHTRATAVVPPTREEDEFGNLFRETFPDGTHRRWVYDANGNVAKFTDREGRTTSFEYAGWNMRAAETDPLGGRVRYRYAPHRHITAVIDAGHTLSEYGYDATERLEEVRRHGVVRETYRHDVAGNLIEKRDADGKAMLHFEYGPANLPLVRRLTSGDVHEFKYDDRGRYLSAKTTAFEVTFDHDESDRRVRDERDGHGVRHTFGPFALTESKVLGKFLVKYDWPTADETTITDPTGAKHTLRVAGNGLTERRFASGTVEVSQYGEGGRCLARVRTGRGGTWARTYRYSPEGDLLAAADSVRGPTTYRYDAAHRVSGVQRPGAADEPIEHDAAGNVLRMPGLTGVRLLDGNRLAAANGERFEYNRRNHIAVRTAGATETRYHYDSRDLLVKVERAGRPDWTAGYDPLGRRAWQAWGDGRRVDYFWDTDRLIAERDDTGRTRVYVYADPFAMVPLLFVEYATPDADPADGKRYYIFADQIGTPTRVEDDRGEVVWSARIDPYGQADVAPGSTIDFSFRFPGHWYDAETGLHYNRFRYYDPVLGRYLQSDPIGLAGGLNLYGYCGGNPLTRVDVRGTCPDPVDGDPPPPKKEDGDPPTEAPPEGPPRPPQMSNDDMWKQLWQAFQANPTRATTEGAIDPTTGQLLVARSGGGDAPPAVVIPPQNLVPGGGDPRGKCGMPRAAQLVADQNGGQIPPGTVVSQGGFRMVRDPPPPGSGIAPQDMPQRPVYKAPCENCADIVQNPANNLQNSGLPPGVPPGLPPGGEVPFTPPPGW